MICVDCHTHFAPFPEKDWDFVGPEFTEDHLDAHGRINGIYPKLPDAEKRRAEIWDNEEPGSCGCLVDINAISILN